MNKAELLAAIKGKSSPYTTPLGLKVDLRPLTVVERANIFAWYDAEKDAKDFGSRLKAKYVSLGLCNGDADSILTEEEAASLKMAAADYDAIADEVARRSGMLAESVTGKELPATPN